MLGRSVLIAALLIASTVHAQPYKPPRTSFGAPDLQGLWDNDSMTSLQRPKDRFKTSIATPYEAAAYEARRYGRYAKVIGPVDPNEPAPTDGKVEDDDRFDKPRGLARIRGEIRASQIVDPADGRLPYTPASAAAAEQALKDEEVYDDPEGRPFDERCILGGGGGIAAPITNRDHIQIVQTPGYVVLAGEQNHEVRIVRIGSPHLPQAIRPWMGDPIGHWEGDTLVVETTNLNPNDRWRWNSGDWIALSSTARIVERFTRTAQDQILYSYVVEDPAHYTQAWRGEAPFHATTARVFEYACHEGNYALANILAGGRQAERDAAAKKGSAP